MLKALKLLLPDLFIKEETIDESSPPESKDATSLSELSLYFTDDSSIDFNLST